jgi:uncharacterized protein (TIGR00730 family)
MITDSISNKAYTNLDFLKSPDARVIRLLAEYLEPQRRLRLEGISDTIVFFGSARIRPMEEAKNLKTEAMRVVQNRGVRSPTKKQIDALQDAETLIKYAHYYEEAVELSKLISRWALRLGDKKQSRFVICSGGGPGIMEAANKGAQLAGAKTIGLNISLPFEQDPNLYVPERFSMEFHYFFMRKFWFVYPAKALVVFPGGFGTMDEFMEVLTLVQTRKLRKQVFVVLYGSAFWKKVINFDLLVESGMIGKEDLRLFQICDSPKEAFQYIKRKLTDEYLNQEPRKGRSV